MSEVHLQPLLEKAVREALTELGRRAAGPERSGAAATRSVEDLVHEVAAKVLRENGSGLSSQAVPNKLLATPEPVKPPAKPLLSDLRSTPWVIWREGLHGQSAHEPVQEDEDVCQPGSGSSLLHEDSVPEDTSVKQRHWCPSLASEACLVAPARERPMLVQGGLTMYSQSSRNLMMQWKGCPRSVLMVIKRGDDKLMATMQDMADWLSSVGICVVLEPQLLSDQPCLKTRLKNVRTFSEADRLKDCIDLVITIGGDGTLTWAVSLFCGAMPPVLSFAAGSLGFLTPFSLDGWVSTLTQLLDLRQMGRHLPLTCRMRLQVVVHRQSGASPNGEEKNNSKPLRVQCLNEVLVHRGQTGSLAKLDVQVDGERVTLLQGDGLILASPTGSTAYSLAAGGSMVHPGVPAILLTPVSPHSLSFRPAILPQSATVTVAVPISARCGAALSIDGKDICQLQLGDSVEVSMSPNPVPTICCMTETKDWFASVHESLQWNKRMEQK